MSRLLELDIKGKKFRLNVSDENLDYLEKGALFQIKLNRFGQIEGLEVLDPKTNAIKCVIPTINSE